MFFSYVEVASLNLYWAGFGLIVYLVNSALAFSKVYKKVTNITSMCESSEICKVFSAASYL